MSTTIIDQLIVTLGLDPTKFKQGEKQAAAALVDVQRTTKKTTDAMSASFAKVARDFVGLFVAVGSIKSAIGYFGNLTRATRQLGIDAGNFGTSAAELRDWQNAVVLAGGKAEEVTQTMGGLQKSLFDLKFNGNFDDQLQYLARLGVQFQTTTGQVRPFYDIMLDTADAVKRNHFDRATANQYLLAAGFDQGSIQLILAGTEAIKARIAEQRKLPQITQADIEASAELAIAWDKLGQKFEAGAVKLETAAEPAIKTIFDLIGRGIDYVNAHRDDIIAWIKDTAAYVVAHKDDIVAFFSKLTDVITGLVDIIGPLVKGFTAVGTALGEGAGWLMMKVIGPAVDYANGQYSKEKTSEAREEFKPDVQRAEQDFEIPQGILDKLLLHESAYDKDALSPKGAKGIAQLMPSLFPNAGIDPKADIRTAAELLNQLYDHFQDWDLAIAAYNAGQTKIDHVIHHVKERAADGTMRAATTPQETLNYVRAITGHVPSVLLPPGAAPIPAAIGAVKLAAPTPRAQASSNAVSRSNDPPPTSRNVSLDIGQMIVNTQATDATGIAADMHSAVRRKFTAAQVDSGLA